MRFSTLAIVVCASALTADAFQPATLKKSTSSALFSKNEKDNSWWAPATATVLAWGMAAQVAVATVSPLPPVDAHQDSFMIEQPTTTIAAFGGGDGSGTTMDFSLPSYSDATKGDVKVKQSDGVPAFNPFGDFKPELVDSKAKFEAEKAEEQAAADQVQKSEDKAATKAAKEAEKAQADADKKAAADAKKAAKEARLAAEKEKQKAAQERAKKEESAPASIPKMDLKVPDMPEFKAPDISMPDMPSFKAPDLSGFKAPSIPAFKAPTIPDFKAPSIPDFKAPDMPDFKAPDMPAMPKMSMPKFAMPAMPKVDMPTMPKLSSPSGGYDLDIPKVSAPKVDMPNISFPKVSLPSFGGGSSSSSSSNAPVGSQEDRDDLARGARGIFKDADQDAKVLESQARELRNLANDKKKMANLAKDEACKTRPGGKFICLRNPFSTGF